MNAAITRASVATFTLAGFGPALVAFLIARAHRTARELSMRVEKTPPMDKAMKRRARDYDLASKARTEAIKARDWGAASAAASRMRKATKDLRELREAQIALLTAGRMSLEASVMASVRGEAVETVETVVLDYERDEDGAIISRRGKKKTIVDKARALRVVERTGLDLAFRSGHLHGGPVNAAALYVTGLKYRDAYEAISKAGIGGVGSGSAPRSSASLGPTDRVLEAARNLATYRMNLSARQKRVLDLICGQDRAIKAASKIIHAGIPATKKLLVAGLTVAHENRTGE